MDSINDQYYDPIPSPVDDSTKEVFTYFGLASYWGQLLEKGYLQLSVSLSILREESPSREDHDRLRTKFEKYTLGKLLVSAKKITTLPDELEQFSLESLDKRNYLIHHFYWKHAEDILSNKGRKLMIDELINLTNLFRQTDHLVNDLIMILLKQQGISEQDVLELRDEMVYNAHERDLSGEEPR